MQILKVNQCINILFFYYFSFYRGPISSYFMQEPDLEGNEKGLAHWPAKFDQTSLIEGAMVPKHYIDNVRQMYLGKPYVIRECTRCTATSLPPPSQAYPISSNDGKSVNGWDRRWSTKCLCGGPWTLTPLQVG